MKKLLSYMKKNFAAICFCAAVLLILPVLSGCSEKKAVKTTSASSKVVFHTVPKGASIFIAGRTLQKVTPTTVAVNNPGVYVVKFSLPGYKTQWKKVELKKGRETVVEVKLAPLRSSLLVAAKADGKNGVQVHYMGKFMGETPIVLRDLPLGKGEIMLSKKGYASIRETFQVENQLPPPAITTELTSNRGGLFVKSIPEKADVKINDVFVGETPLKLSLEEGQHKLEIHKAGYKVAYRDFEITRKQDTVIPVVKLIPLPAVLRVTTVPAGGRLFINDTPKGDANGDPVALEAGRYTIRVEKDGFDDTVEDIVLKGGEKKKLTLRMDTVMGALEIVTKPAGVAVFVDGKLVGRSKADPANPKISGVLRVENLRRGKHTVTVTHKRAKRPRGGRLSVEIEVKKGETTRVDQHQLKLWVPDIKILMKSGEVREGIFLYNQPDGSLHYEPRPGMGVTLKKELIRKVEKLPVEDI
ncbi:MAG: PEGA domain-containing protein [Lentisphaeria bacterium]|nr:PEGA domain-containing protein [Lentisphaeria bacterium]